MKIVLVAALCFIAQWSQLPNIRTAQDIDPFNCGSGRCQVPPYQIRRDRPEEA